MYENTLRFFPVLDPFEGCPVCNVLSTEKLYSGRGFTWPVIHWNDLQIMLFNRIVTETHIDEISKK